MREIKFRGKTKQGEWVEGSYVYAHKWFGTGEAGHFITSIYGSDRVLVMPEMIGQFTGLYDKNGKEIYEGDIVECKVIGTDEIRRALVGIGECGDSDEELCYGVWLLWDKEKGVFYKEYSSYVEVIGNIYDNPELIKE